MITEDEKNQMKKEILDELCEYIPGLKERLEWSRKCDSIPIGETITVMDGFSSHLWKKIANDKWELADGISFMDMELHKQLIDEIDTLGIKAVALHYGG